MACVKQLFFSYLEKNKNRTPEKLLINLGDLGAKRRQKGEERKNCGAVKTIDPGADPLALTIL